MRWKSIFSYLTMEITLYRTMDKPNEVASVHVQPHQTYQNVLLKFGL